MVKGYDTDIISLLPTGQGVMTLISLQQTVAELYGHENLPMWHSNVTIITALQR